MKLVKALQYFTDRSKAVLLLWMFYVFLSCVSYAFVRVCLFVPAVKGLTSWLSLVVYNCEFVTFPVVPSSVVELDCINS